MKDFDLRIINDFVFPDQTIKAEVFRILNLKKMREYAKEPKNFSQHDMFLLSFYLKSISEYTKNDKVSQAGSFFHSRRNGYVTNYDNLMLSDILYATVFSLFYNFVLAKGIFTYINGRYNISSNSGRKKLYFSLLGGMTVLVIGHAFSTFRKRVNVLDKKYYPVSRFIKYKALGVDFYKI